MKNQIFVLSFMFCLLLAGLGSIYGQSEQSIAGLSVTEKKKLVEDYLRRNGLDRQGIPEIVVIDAPGDEFGIYHHKGSTRKYDDDTIELYEQAFSSLGEMEVTIRHEMQHYWIDHGDVPSDLEEEWSALPEKIESAFDFSQFKREVARALLKQIVALAEHEIEEWFISKGILEESRIYEDPENARKGAAQTLQHYKQELDAFWESPKTVYKGSEQQKVRPGGDSAKAGISSNEEAAAADNPYARMNMAGDYECVSGQGSEGKSGTIVYNNGAQKQVTKQTPMVVTQQGAQISMKGVITTDSEAVNSKSMKATAVKSRQEHGGTATITGREFKIQWVTRIVSTGGSYVVRGFNGNIISQQNFPPKDDTWTVTATIRILREGAFELIRVDNQGKTIVQRYVRG